MNFTPPALSQPLGFADGDAERFPRREVNRKFSQESLRKGQNKQVAKDLRWIDSLEAATTVSSLFPSFSLSLVEITTSLLSAQSLSSLLIMLNKLLFQMLKNEC